MELPRRANERTEFPNRISRQTCTFRRPARAFPRSERGLSRPIPTRYRSRTCRCDSEPRRCPDVHARCRLMQRRCRDVPSDVFHIPLNCRSKPFDFRTNLSTFTANLSMSTRNLLASCFHQTAVGVDRGGSATSLLFVRDAHEKVAADGAPSVAHLEREATLPSGRQR